MGKLSPLLTFLTPLFTGVLLVAGVLFGAKVGTTIGTLTEELTTPATFGIGIGAGIAVVAITVVGIWSSITVTIIADRNFGFNKDFDWYVPVSWFFVGLPLGNVITLVAMHEAGTIAATGFVVAYVASSIIPPCVDFYVGPLFRIFNIGTDAMSVLLIALTMTVIAFIATLVVTKLGLASLMALSIPITSHGIH